MDWNLDSNHKWNSGFLELYSWFQSPWFRIPQAKIVHVFRNPIVLYVGRVKHSLKQKLFDIKLIGFWWTCNEMSVRVSDMFTLAYRYKMHVKNT